MAEQSLAQRAYVTHGHSRVGHVSPEYRAWKKIKYRCFDPRSASFHLYGGAGVTMAPEWRHDFAAFLAHIGPRPSRKHSVDRRDSTGNYEPGNVRWATPIEQGLNRKTTVWLEFRGERLCLSHMAGRYGMSTPTLFRRLKSGLTLEEALTR